MLRPRVAVLVSGLVGRSERDRQFDIFGVNPVLGHSPIQSWRMWLGKEAQIYTCTDLPLPPTRVLAGQFVFESASQFDRLRQCIERVEPDVLHARYTAYLRLRPDSMLLGPLPRNLLDRPDPHSVYVRWRMYNPAHAMNQDRDSMECGSCEQWCECAQRKYGQVLFKATGDCGTPTDKIFYFGNGALPAMMSSLENYSVPSGHSARSPTEDAGHCVVAGRMVESGLGRVFEDHGLLLQPLPLRHALQRDLQPTTPQWASVSCVLTWTSARVPCTGPCTPANATAWRRPLALRGPWAGCNPVDRQKSGVSVHVS